MSKHKVKKEPEVGQDNELPKLVPMDEEKDSTYTREGNGKTEHRQTFLDACLIDCSNTAKSQGTLQVPTRSQRR